MKLGALIYTKRKQVMKQRMKMNDWTEVLIQMRRLQNAFFENRESVTMKLG